MINTFEYEISKLNNTVIIAESVAYFGVEAQIDKAIEEVIELANELAQYKKYLVKRDAEKLVEIRTKILTERIDVGIMLKDIDIIMDYKREEICGVLNFQLKKLKKYIEDFKNS